MGLERRRVRLLPAAVAIGALAAGAFACTGAPAGPPERVTIPPKATFATVTDSLAAHGIVRYRLWFKLLARIKGVDRSVKAGVYELPRNASTGEVLATLAAGRTASARLTVPEGFTTADIATIAFDRLGIPADSFLAAARDTAELRTLGIDAPSLEGFLRPETYAVPLGSSARDVVRMMAESFKAQWRPEWTARLDTIGMTQLQVITLASIVEGEARADTERETIAGVYRNRLRIGMALQADPTVQYALLLNTGRRKPRLYEKDYQVQSPYNTYLHPGLPPGPVNSPGRRSIEAALYPADVPYLYFVAGPDGRHLFSRSYDEHLRNVARMRRLAREAERAQR
ncbi:MAG TPA: endolytic transglycosylase MltG [Gemmatimonadales bacterium]|nr:endolytic transglycosylase MltG [Gemmatimonadales bacterium]